VTEPTENQQVRVRRAPKIPVFLVLGGALGAIVTLVLTSLFETDPTVGFGASFGYFLIYGVPAGVVLGAIVALILDRGSNRRAKTVSAQHEQVEGAPLEGELED